MNNDYDKEDLEFEQEKAEGLYQADSNAEAQEETVRKGGMALGAVYALVGFIVVFIAVGYSLDKYLQTSPWFIVIGVILGTMLGFYQFIRISSKPR